MENNKKLVCPDCRCSIFKVKPLVWGICNNHMRAEIFKYPDGISRKPYYSLEPDRKEPNRYRAVFWYKENGCDQVGTKLSEEFLSIEEAQATAQKHFEEFIISHIEEDE